MAQQLFTKIKKILPFIGIILFILYIIYFLDITEILAAITAIPPYYFLIIALLTIPRVLIRNLAWKLIQTQQNIHLSFTASLKIFLIGYFYGSFTPGYIGQLMRIPYMKEKTHQPYGKLFINSVIETVLHTFSLYIMMIIGAILVFSMIPDLLTYTVLWLLILISILLYFIKKERGEQLLLYLITKLSPRSFKPYFNRFIGSFYQDFPPLKKLILPTLVGSLTWIIIFSQEYLFVIALDLDIPYIYFLMLFPVANTVGFIPITTAGIGTREFVAILIFTSLFAVTAEEILVVSLLGFVTTDVFTGFVGFLVSLTETRHVSLLNNIRSKT